MNVSHKFLGAALAAALLFPAAWASAEFKVGFAKVDVTPQAPVPMWGYGARHDLLSQGTRDPLYAKALVIESGGEKLALIGLDLGRSPGDPEYGRICEAVKAQAGVAHVMMSGSHTHHGPVLELKDEPGKGQGKFDAAVAYRSELEKKLIAVIVEAAGKTQLATVGWSSKEVDMNRNRHAKVEPKPRDPELSVIRFNSTAGKPLAVLVNFSAHPTMLDGSDLRFSAEYPGVMMNTVEAALGTNCFFMQGAAGDMSCNPAAEDNLPDNDPSLAAEKLPKEQREQIMALRKVSEEDALKAQQNMVRDDAKMVNFGTRLGKEVIALAESTETKAPAKESIEGFYKNFEFKSRVNFKNPAIQAMFRGAFFPELADASVDDVADNIIRTRLSVVLLNDELAMVGGSGEFFCNHSARIKERSGAAKTLFFGYCNGHNMYFPTIEAASQGGYGADPTVSWVSLGAGEEMMNEALVQLFVFLDKLKLEPEGA
ncbi:MAG: hypothetical protein HYV27_07440 [Candidatus Hydrogenedentes bacterium]|nr:hypothetical protein [Candidatus Hydrogenedentota bacterium]